MKITDIKTYPLWVGIRNQLVVKVETDSGIYGLGESGLSGRELAVIGALKHFREVLSGGGQTDRSLTGNGETHVHTQSIPDAGERLRHSRSAWHPGIHV